MVYYIICASSLCDQEGTFNFSAYRELYFITAVKGKAHQYISRIMIRISGLRGVYTRRPLIDSQAVWEYRWKASSW
jgi:hypothetical protein